jgi:hypothetical protein
MASRFVFCAAGLYPNVGQPIYLLHGPRFPRVVFVLENGREFVIEGDGVSGTNRYVTSATLDGAPLERAWVTHEEVARGGVLRFTMGASPSAWGGTNLPPSPLLAEPSSIDCTPSVASHAVPLSIVPTPARGVVTLWVEARDPITSVDLAIFDALGRRVRQLEAGPLSRRRHVFEWNGIDDRGAPVGAGSYFCRLRSSGMDESVRFVFLP